MEIALFFAFLAQLLHLYFWLHTKMVYLYFSAQKQISLHLHVGFSCVKNPSLPLAIC